MKKKMNLKNFQNISIIPRDRNRDNKNTSIKKQLENSENPDKKFFNLLKSNKENQRIEKFEDQEGNISTDTEEIERMIVTELNSISEKFLIQDQRYPYICLISVRK